MANALTLSRILLIPVFVYFLFSKETLSLFIAITIFAIASLTDWFDGWVARRYDNVTNFGIMIDPLADRLLILATTLALFVRLEGAIPLSALILIAMRDTLILIGYSLLRKRSKFIPVSYIGKTATAIFFMDLFALLLSLEFQFLLQPAIYVLFVGIALYWIAFFDYIFKAYRSFKA